MEVLKHTDGTLLVSTTDAVALSDSERTAELSTRVGGNTLGVVLTRAREPVHVDEIRSGLDLPILGAIPLYEQEFIDEPVTVAAGSSPAAQAYRNVTSQFVPICVDGADPDELELIPDSEWLRTETRDEESARDNDGLLL